MEMCEVLLIIIIIILFIFFCTYLRMHFYIFNCLSFKLSFYDTNIFYKMVCLLWVFDSFTDHTYGDAFFLSLT